MARTIKQQQLATKMVERFTKEDSQYLAWLARTGKIDEFVDLLLDVNDVLIRNAY